MVVVKDLKVLPGRRDGAIKQKFLSARGQSRLEAKWLTFGHAARSLKWHAKSRLLKVEVFGATWFESAVAGLKATCESTGRCVMHVWSSHPFSCTPQVGLLHKKQSSKNNCTAEKVVYIPLLTCNESIGKGPICFSQYFVFLSFPNSWFLLRTTVTFFLSALLTLLTAHTALSAVSTMT